jgi:hypothetical protein
MRSLARQIFREESSRQKECPGKGPKLESPLEYSKNIKAAGG